MTPDQHVATGTPVLVPAEVRDAILWVRNNGWANMFDQAAVTAILTTAGATEAARWVKRNSGHYMAGICVGMETLE